MVADFIMNNLIATETLAPGQKAFLKKTSGCVEHSTLLEHLFEIAERSGLPLAFIQTDLANAYGSLNHKMIMLVLKMYRIPTEIADLIANMYSDLHMWVPHPDGIIKTPFKRGVFQGDPLSVILFLLAINPVLWRLEEEDAKACGFKIAHPTTGVTSVTNLGFCDDINLVANDDAKATELCKILDEAMDWTKCLKLEPAKCKGMLVERTCTPREISEGPLTIKRPNATFKGIQVGQLQGVSFRMLGQRFKINLSLAGSTSEAKDVEVERAIEYIERIDRSVHSDEVKLKIAALALRSFLSWTLMCANLDTTRAAKIHAVLTRKGKQWAGLTLSANTTVLFRKRNGYGLPDLITLNKTELSRRASQMRGSRDPLMRAIIDHRTAHQASNKTAQMLFDTKSIHWKPELHAYTMAMKDGVQTKMSKQELKERRDENLQGRHTDNEEALKMMEVQGAYAREEEKQMKEGPVGEQFCLNEFPPHLAKFIANSQLDVLPTQVNLCRWGKSNSKECPLCGGYATLHHVISNCPVSLTQGRYTWRHDRILQYLHNLGTASNYWETLTDLKGAKTNYHVLPFWILPDCKQRPDLIVYNTDDKKMCVMELTVPHEEGMRAANIRKLARYDALLQQIKDNLTGWEVNLHCMEIGTRGLIGTTMLETLTILKVPKKDNIQHQKNLKQIAAQSTQHIFRARHAHWWTEPNMSNDREEPMTVLQIAGTQPTTTTTTSSNTVTNPTTTPTPNTTTTTTTNAITNTSTTSTPTNTTSTTTNITAIKAPENAQTEWPKGKCRERDCQHTSNTQGNAAYHARTKHPVTPTLKLACPIPSCTKMVKTAAQLKDHYTNSHTDCMIEYEVEKIMAHRNKKGKPMEYHIKWLGYEDPADDSWEPEGGLTRDGTVDNTHLNQYKQENNLQ